MHFKMFLKKYSFHLKKLYISLHNVLLKIVSHLKTLTPALQSIDPPPSPPTKLTSKENNSHITKSLEKYSPLTSFSYRHVELGCLTPHSIEQEVPWSLWKTPGPVKLLRKQLKCHAWWRAWNNSWATAGYSNEASCARPHSHRVPNKNIFDDQFFQKKNLQIIGRGLGQNVFYMHS